MADITEQQEKNWFSEFFGKITTELSWLLNKIKESINSLFWKEIFEVTTQTKKDLKKLEEDILKIDDSKLWDNEIEENVEWKVDKEDSVLWLLVKNSQDVKNWFKRIKDIDDEDMVSREMENILLMVKKLSNNDSDPSKWDLTKQELKGIWKNVEKKMKICDKIFKNDTLKNTNGEVINLPEDKRTKKLVLDACNTILSENNWDILEKIEEKTEEEIIGKIVEKLMEQSMEQ